MNQREGDKHKNEDNSYHWEENRVKQISRNKGAFNSNYNTLFLETNIKQAWEKC